MAARGTRERAGRALSGVGTLALDASGEKLVVSGNLSVTSLSDSKAHAAPADAGSDGTAHQDGQRGRHRNGERGVEGREGTGPAADLLTAEKNVAEAAPNVIRDLKSGELNIGLDERTLEGGFDSIKFRAVDDVPGVAGIEYKVWQGLDGERFGDLVVTIDRQGAVTLGETYRSIGHELGHLVPHVRTLSPIPPPGMSGAFSPQERAAERIGMRVGKHFGF